MKKVGMHNAIITIPNILTSIRIGLIPGICTAMVLNYWIIAGILLFIAGITDVLDGFLARLLNQESQLGVFLDPLADKLLVIGMGIVFVFKGYINALSLWLIVIKELILLLGSAYLVIFKYRIPFGAKITGKIAMFCSLLYFSVASLCFIAGYAFFDFLYYGMFFVVGIHWGALLHYVIIAFNAIYMRKTL